MPYEATLLRAKEGKRLAKLYRKSADSKPLPYDAGYLFRAEPISCGTFGEFVDVLGALPSDVCLVRGGVKDDALPDVLEGLDVRRLAYDEDDCPAAFEERARNWVMLDLDKSDSPFDPDDIEGSIEYWRESLPPEIRDAQSAFFLSASSHRESTLRGKLLVALREPLDNASAAAWASAHGFDGSVCHTVQPNYLAAPIFDRCRDPLEGKRAPVLLPGKPTRLPALPPGERKHATLKGRERVPDDLPPLSKRASALADAIIERWLEGNRVESNAWLHLAGWCLGKGWSKGEIGSMLRVLDSLEDDAEKRAEHWHILGNARPIDGPGGARAWLGDDFDRVNEHVNHDPVMTAYAERRARRAHHAPVANDVEADPWDSPLSFLSPDEPIDYYCEGLRLAPSKGKISLIAGQPGGAKGPVANHLAVCFALGEKAFGEHECKRKKVLLLDCEGARLTMLRLRRLARGLGHEPAELEGWIQLIDASTLDLTSEEAQARLARVVAEREIGVVILDSYTTAMLPSGVEATSPQYALLARQLGTLGVLVLAVGHANKAAAERGGEPRLSDVAHSGALAALAQTAIVVHYPDHDDKNVVHIGFARTPDGPAKSFEVRFEGAKDDPCLRVTLYTRAATPAGKTKIPAGVKELRRGLTDVARYSESVVDLLQRVDTLRVGMSVAKLIGTLRFPPKLWPDVRADLIKRKAIVEVSLPSDRDVKVRLAGADNPAPAERVLPTVEALQRRRE